MRVKTIVDANKISRVFLAKHKKILEEIEKLNSRLRSYYCLPAVEKCLDKSLQWYFDFLSQVICF